MKKLILAAITVTTAASVFAQGTVIFNNRLGGISHVWAGGTSQVQGNTAADTPAGSTVYATPPYVLIGTVGGLNPSTTFAQLLAAPGSGAAEASLVPSGGTTTFRTGAGSGNIVQITDTLNNIPKDSAFATFEMVAWDNSSGLYPTWAQASAAIASGTALLAGRSAPFTVASIGGDVNTPPNLVGLTSFNIFTTTVPEPTTVTLAGLGAAALLIFRRRK
jgi:hypothetical protein